MWQQIIIISAERDHIVRHYYARRRPTNRIVRPSTPLLPWIDSLGFIWGSLLVMNLLKFTLKCHLLYLACKCGKVFQRKCSFLLHCFLQNSENKFFIKLIWHGQLLIKSVSLMFDLFADLTVRTIKCRIFWTRNKINVGFFSIHKVIFRHKLILL